MTRKTISIRDFEDNEFKAEDGIELLNEHGEAVFFLDFEGDTLQVSSGYTCTIKGKVYSGGLRLEPVAMNAINVTRKQR